MKSIRIVVSTALILGYVSVFANPTNLELRAESASDTIAVKAAIAAISGKKHLLALEKPIGKKVFVKVYGRTGILIHHKEVGNVKDAHIRYDFNNLPKGAYKIEIVSADGQTLFEDIVSVK
ncbi:MAG: hypothetical protein ACXITV_07340 [Luteibaculaceae bacterium]